MVKFLRRITDNWKLKALAFALAVLLWTVVTAEQPTTGWFRVPLEIVVTDPNYRLEGDELPRDVEVRFTGPGRDLLDLALRRPALRLTVTGIEDESESRSLDPRMVQLSGQVAVSALDVRPASLQLQFVRIDSKEVPVQTRVVAELGEAWAIVDTLRADPGTVRITGPIRQLESIQSIATETVTLTPADTIVDQVVGIDTASVPGIQLSTRQVRVTGRVDRVVARTIPGVPVDVGPGIGILPSAVTVTLRGPMTAVQAVSPELFRVVISIDGIPTRIPPGGVLVPLRIDGLRPGIEARLEPAQVRLFPQTQADTVGSPAITPALGTPIITTPDLQ